MSDPIFVPASRRTADGGNTIVEAPELRHIVVAQGIEFNRRDHFEVIASHPDAPAAAIAAYRAGIFPDALPARVPGVFVYELNGQQRALYYSRAQHVTYTMELVEDKRSFMQALGTDGIIVIYDGHARYGRGPCFGPDKGPGDDWERGTTPAERGLFRMGFPCIGVSLHDILHHGYRTAALPATEPRPDRADCDPDLRPHLGRLTARGIAELQAGEAERESLATQLGVPADGAARFWAYREKGEWHLVLREGWEDPGYPYNLGSTELRCRLFCHLGCSTYAHNYPVLRKLKGWKREANDRFAYWTTAPSYAGTSVTLLSHLLTYPKKSGGEPWEPWLRYGVRSANGELRKRKYQLI